MASKDSHLEVAVNTVDIRVLDNMRLAELGYKVLVPHPRNLEQGIDLHDARL